MRRKYSFLIITILASFLFASCQKDIPGVPKAIIGLVEHNQSKISYVDKYLYYEEEIYVFDFGEKDAFCFNTEGRCLGFIYTTYTDEIEIQGTPGLSSFSEAAVFQCRVWDRINQWNK